MPQVIEMIVSPKGETTITTSGFKGRSCREATRELENALGQVLESQDTPEAFEQEELKIERSD